MAEDKGDGGMSGGKLLAAAAAVLLLGFGAGLAGGLIATAPGPAPSVAASAVDSSFSRPAPRRVPMASPRIELPDPDLDEAAPETLAAPPPMAYPPLPEVTDPEAEAERPQVATLPVPPPSALAPKAGRSDWLRFAMPAPESRGRAMVAVVIDDMGVDRRRSERIVALPGPLTTSYLFYAADLPVQTAAARGHGHELMVHVPMQPLGTSTDPGPHVLTTDLSPEEIRKRLSYGLGRFEGYVGINNHMGSKFTAFAPGMRVVMEELRGRGLLFLDSMTSARSVGLPLARNAGVPTIARNIFLDNVSESIAVMGQLAQVEELAQRTGFAVAIGHPRDATIEALAAWLPSLEGKGLVLVPLTAIVKRTQPAG